MIQKQLYSAPEAELLVVRFEGNFMASDFEVNQLKEGKSSWWDDEDENN